MGSRGIKQALGTLATGSIPCRVLAQQILGQQRGEMALAGVTVGAQQYGMGQLVAADLLQHLPPGFVVPGQWLSQEKTDNHGSRAGRMPACTCSSGNPASIAAQRCGSRAATSR